MAIVRIQIDDKYLQRLDAFGASYTLASDNVSVLSASDLNPADFLFLKGKDGKEGHPDLLYAKSRLQASPLVKTVVKVAGMDVADTAQEKNGRMYMGNFNHEQALRLNLLLGGRTTNVGIETEVFRMLLSGKAFDGNGRKVDSSELRSILDEKIGVRNPIRAEWYEDSFKSQDGGIVLMRDYVLQNGVLVPGYVAPLQAYLTKSQTPGIDLKSWVRNPNTQGWPRADVKRGETYYWPPTVGYVAGLCAGSDWADLDGDWGPLYANSWLGVRHLRVAPKK